MSNYQYEQELNIHCLLSPIQTFFTELDLLVTNNNERNATRECKSHKRKRSRVALQRNGTQRENVNTALVYCRTLGLKSSTISYKQTKVEETTK